MEAYLDIDIATLVTPVGLLVLAIRRCIKMDRFQFSIKDGLCVPWLLLPALLLSQISENVDFNRDNCAIVGAFHVIGGFFFWTHSNSPIGSWERSIKFFLGAFVLTFPYVATHFIGEYIAFFGSKYSDSHATVYVIIMNLAVVGFSWLSAVIMCPLPAIAERKYSGKDI
jgi:hypothetical protein